MVFKDYYRILELDTNKLSKEEIKEAYRLLAKKYHPDMNIKNPKAEERFKDINEAYQVLTNKNAKRKYDRIWLRYRGNKRGEKRESIFNSFVNMFFGRQDKTGSQDKKLKIKGEDIETEISVTLEEVFFGTEKILTLRTLDNKTKSFTVKIPRGIRNNEKIRIPERGKAGNKGGKNGDLLVKVKIQNHDNFILEGSDLKTIVKLTPWEAALGTKVTLNTIDGETVIFIPSGICSDEEIRVPKKGYITAFGSRGDLIVTVKIFVPKELTEQERILFKQLADISKFASR